MDRLDFFKRLGIVVGGATILGVDSIAKAAAPSDKALMPKEGEDFDSFNAHIRGLKADVSKPVTVIIIGAGGRGSAYASYAKRFPECMKVVGVSDINPARLKKMADAFDVKPAMRFADYSEVFKSGKLPADAVVISTPDDVHYAPCMLALENGYDVLLEKPIAPTESECTDILALAKKKNRVVAVCHVLRYAPFWIALKQAVDSGMIGEVVSTQLLEPVGFDHMAHSYVRGNWRSSKKTTPIILAKSCHDLDILNWVVGKKCETVSADGNIKFFKAANAPKGATKRCTDGCPHEKECAFSAINIYVRRKRMLKVFDLPKVDDALIMEKLRTTDYGRCVFYSDNDQPEHYVVNLVYAGGATAAFSMEGLTSYAGRRVRVMGTKGDIVGDMTEFVITDFLTAKKTVWYQKVDDLAEYKDAGHGGGDHGLVRDFLSAVDKQNPALLSSTIDASVESHVIGFSAEKSRLSMNKIRIK